MVDFTNILRAAFLQKGLILDTVSTEILRKTFSEAVCEMLVKLTHGVNTTCTILCFPIFNVKLECLIHMEKMYLH